MRRTLLALVCLPTLVFAQRPGQFRETAEPPLADSPAGLKLTAGREAGPLPPVNSRLTDATAPLVQLTVKAPPAVATGREVEIRLTVENLSRVAAKNVVVS